MSSSLVHFDAMDLQTWAGFSGDYNPIHFDRDAARALGASELIVHGMLPILASQALLHREHLEQTSGWHTLRLRLARPLLLGETAVLVCRPTNEGTAFSMTREGPEPVLLMGGQARPSEPLVSLDEDGARSQAERLDTFHATSILDRCVEFERRFPHYALSPWISLSAVGFAAFVCHGYERLLALVQRSVCRSTQALSVMQSSHAVRMRPDGLTRNDLAHAELFLLPEDVTVLADRIVARCAIQVNVGGCPVLALDIGLVLFEVDQANWRYAAPA